MPPRWKAGVNDLPRGTVTFLFTDIGGSSQHWEQDPVAMQAALAAHDEAIRKVIHATGGSIFKTIGDGFCVAYANPADAPLAAVRIQEGLRSIDWGTAAPLAVRLGLHSGAAEPREGDYLGPPVNWVARLLAAGHGGQVLVPDATRQLVVDVLPDGLTLLDLGPHELRELQRPERVY